MALVSAYLPFEKAYYMSASNCGHTRETFLYVLADSSIDYMRAWGSQLEQLQSLGHSSG